MAYNGISPYLFKNSVSTADTFDDISTSFNGVTTTFNITIGGAEYTRLTAKACLIILGGIVQEAGIDYTVNAGQITFTTAPVAGLTFEGRHLFGLNGVDTLSSGGNLTVDGNINIVGEIYVQGKLVNFVSVDYGLITGAVDSSTDYGGLS
jgi:hypothetical protein